MPHEGTGQSVAQFQRGQLFEQFRDRPRLGQLEGAPPGTLITQTGQIIPGAPDPEIFDVSEEEARFEISDFLGELERRSEVLEPIAARRAFAEPAGRGFGISGIAELASRRAVAGEGARLARETNVAISESRRDILNQRQIRESNRQRTREIAIREERELQDAARFELGLGLEEIRQREEDNLARELAALQRSVQLDAQFAEERLNIQRHEAEEHAAWEEDQAFSFGNFFSA